MTRLNRSQSHGKFGCCDHSTTTSECLRWSMVLSQDGYDGIRDAFVTQHTSRVRSPPAHPAKVENSIVSGVMQRKWRRHSSRTGSIQYPVLHRQETSEARERGLSRGGTSHVKRPSLLFQYGCVRVCQGKVNVKRQSSI